MGDLISRQDAIDAIKEMRRNYTETKSEQHPHVDFVIEELMKIPSAQSEIIRCKDCRKHNVKVGIDEDFNVVWKEDACPLVNWRGKAQEHEFDYQYCVYAKRREE